jgi:hypothetical protein
MNKLKWHYNVLLRSDFNSYLVILLAGLRRTTATLARIIGLKIEFCIVFCIEFGMKWAWLNCRQNPGTLLKRLIKSTLFISHNSLFFEQRFDPENFQIRCRIADLLALGLGKVINKTGNVSVNVTLRRVCVTIFAVKSNNILHILSVCLQPCVSSMQCACAMLYCHLWPVWIYCIFHIIS